MNQPQSPSRPYWLPEGVNFDELPSNLQTAVVEILNPAYKDLVLEAPSAFEKAFGISLVKLIWLEVLEERELAAGMIRMVPAGDSTAAHQDAIGRHLRLIGAKVNVGKCLIQVRKHLKHQWQL